METIKVEHSRGIWSKTTAWAGRRWVVVTGCGQWMVVGDRSWAVGGRRGRFVVVIVACVLLGTGTHLACDVACHVVVIVAGGGCERMVMVGGGGCCSRPW